MPQEHLRSIRESQGSIGEHWEVLGVLANVGEYWGVLGSVGEYWGMLGSMGTLGSIGKLSINHHPENGHRHHHLHHNLPPETSKKNQENYRNSFFLRTGFPVIFLSFFCCFLAYLNPSRGSKIALPKALQDSPGGCGGCEHLRDYWGGLGSIWGVFEWYRGSIGEYLGSILRV